MRLEFRGIGHWARFWIGGRRILCTGVVYLEIVSGKLAPNQSFSRVYSDPYFFSGKKGILGSFLPADFRIFGLLVVSFPANLEFSGSARGRFPARSEWDGIRISRARLLQLLVTLDGREGVPATFRVYLEFI